MWCQNMCELQSNIVTSGQSVRLAWFWLRHATKKNGKPVHHWPPTFHSICWCYGVGLNQSSPLETFKGEQQKLIFPNWSLGLFRVQQVLQWLVCFHSPTIMTAKTWPLPRVSVFWPPWLRDSEDWRAGAGPRAHSKKNGFELFWAGRFTCMPFYSPRAPSS